MIKNLCIAGVAAALLVTGVQAAKGQRGGGGSATTLTSAQKDTLVLVYQEEKVARDVYITLGNVYPNQSTFANIQGSEQQHMDKARGLCETYNADISAIDEGKVGEFVLPVMQEFYDTLTAQGKQNETEALKVGVAIEVMDIDDLEHAKEGMPSDVQNVYTNLINGSWNHLAAFNSALGK